MGIKLTDQDRWDQFVRLIKDVTAAHASLMDNHLQDDAKELLWKAVEISVARYRIQTVFPATEKTFLGYMTQNAYESGLNLTSLTREHVWSATNAVVYPLLELAKSFGEYVRPRHLSEEVLTHLYEQMREKMGWVFCLKSENLHLRKFQTQKVYDSYIDLYKMAAKEKPGIVSELVKVELEPVPGYKKRRVPRLVA